MDNLKAVSSSKLQKLQLRQLVKFHLLLLKEIYVGDRRNNLRVMNDLNEPSDKNSTESRIMIKSHRRTAGPPVAGSGAGTGTGTRTLPVHGAPGIGYPSRAKRSGSRGFEFDSDFRSLCPAGPLPPKSKAPISLQRTKKPLIIKASQLGTAVSIFYT